ncbi:hypothetical protein DCAR_0730326 [Daucus carota subsp. sativus]|uniref:Uncharacterized protein n=1 Tax=Daucus carota subsp. sativus TaxID=79200 RepID=A0AAF1BBD6_DAUCS|nr:hypothetical protein DCAR_0730326 [Daucus carota subsp. sativus]
MVFWSMSNINVVLVRKNVVFLARMTECLYQKFWIFL